VTVTVEDVQTQMRNSPFISSFVLVAEKEQGPRRPGGPASKPHGRPGNQTSAPTLATPNLKWREFDRTDVALRISHDPNGDLEYFANEKNSYLTDAIVRGKEEEHALIKFWFGYGLLLCALGMIKQQQERNEESNEADRRDDDDESTEADDFGRVGFYCDGIARVIIPLIRTLYRGPQS